MARLLGPDANSRLAYIPSINMLRNAQGLSAVVYAAATGSTLANIATYDGTATPGAVITNATLTVDSNSLIPFFWFPDGVDTVYIELNGGTRIAANADYDARIDNKLSLSGGSITGTLDVADRLRYAGFRVPSMFPRTRLPRRPVALTSYIMQTGHGWAPGGAGTATSDANDTTDFILGTQSIRVTTTGTAAQSQVRKTGLSFDLTDKMFRLIFKVTDVTHLNRIELIVASSSFANFFKWTFHTHSGVNPNIAQSGEWVTVQFGWSDVTSASGSYSINSNGTPSTTVGFDALQLNVFDDGVAAITYRLQAVEILSDISATFPNGVISITFDDSYVTQYSLARPKMDALGYRGTAYTIADVIDSNHNVYMNLSELKSLQNFSGWEIAGHAYSSSNHGQTNGFASLTAEQTHTDFTKLKLWLNDNGFNSDNFAYPKGHFGVTTDGVPVDEIASKYWATSRSIISETKEALSPAMPQRIRAKTGISSVGTTVASIIAAGGMLDRTLNSGDWLILCLHKIVTGTATATDEISQTDFNTLMDAINSRAIPVFPINDVIRYYN